MDRRKKMLENTHEVEENKPAFSEADHTNQLKWHV